MGKCKVGSINYHRKIHESNKGYVLLPFGLFSAKFVSSLSRYARITPSFIYKLTSKTALKSNKANL